MELEDKKKADREQKRAKNRSKQERAQKRIEEVAEDKIGKGKKLEAALGKARIKQEKRL